MTKKENRFVLGMVIYALVFLLIAGAVISLAFFLLELILL